MKKLLVFGLSLAMLLSLTACHKPQAEQQDTSQPDPATTSTPADVSTPAPVEDTPETEPPATPTPEPVKDTTPEVEAPEAPAPEPPADPAPAVVSKPEQPPVTPVKKDTPKSAEETPAPEPPAEQTPPAPAETEEQQTKPSGGQQPTGDTQGRTSVHDPWNSDYSNVVVDTRTEEQKQADIEEARRASEAVVGTIQAGGLG